MKQYYSISETPGRTGYFYYNNFFQHYGIDAVYNPIGIDKDNFLSRFAKIKETASGINISMPYKLEVIKLLDWADNDVKTYNSCNTIVVDNGKLLGYNTDIFGVRHVTKGLNKNYSIAILGNGAMGKMFAEYLSQNKYHRVSLVSRSKLNWNMRNDAFDVIINCTPFGTKNCESPITAVNSQTKIIIDLAVQKGILYDMSVMAGTAYISGKVFYKHQFLEQFKIHTGYNIDSVLYDSVTK